MDDNCEQQLKASHCLQQLMTPMAFYNSCGLMSTEAHTSTPPSTDWKHQPGRPRRNWLQQVEEDIGLSVGTARIAGQDRSM